MSFKRVANTELNHDNWNEDEESEEVGQFKIAAEDVLKNRVRKVAKRRIPETDQQQPASNPFSGFGGFGSQKSSLVTSTPSPFSFLSKIPPATNGSAPKSTENAFKIDAKMSPAKTDSDSKNTEYLSKVKSLNQAFLEWIKSNIDESKGLCDLSPIFKDYEKYMKDCEELKNKKAVPEVKVAESKQEEKKETAAPATSTTFTFGKPATSVSSSASIFSSKPADTQPKESTSPAKPFSFGIAPTNSNLSTAPSFSFGLQKTSTANAAAPLFGNLTGNSTAPFSFGNVTQNAATVAATQNTAEEEAEEEPPKNEFVPVVEEDSLYSKRCKVFVKSGADYADRGIGTLFLKKVEDKVQLIVRADTNLGNILLNIIICDGLPTSRLGKNNVMIVCLPTPESKPPPIPVLIRVKTSDEADELLSTLEKYKTAE